MKIVIAIPCYNCETQLPRLLNELNSNLSDQNDILQVCIIDNCSSDRTIAAAQNLISSFKKPALYSIYQNYENAGLGGTHKIGFTLSNEMGASHLLIIHGDHQASPSDITKLIKKLIEAGGLTTLGSRFSDLTLLSGYSRFRILGNLALNLLYTLVTGRYVVDLGSGLNIFRLTDFKIEHVQNFDNGFTFNMDLLLYLIKNKIPFQYVPIRWSTTDQVSNAHALKVGYKTMNKLWPWLLNRKLKNLHHTKSKKIITTN